MDEDKHEAETDKLHKIWHRDRRIAKFRKGFLASNAGTGAISMEMYEGGHDPVALWLLAIAVESKSFDFLNCIYYWGTVTSNLLQLITTLSAAALKYDMN